jgi:hypothetical protein
VVYDRLRQAQAFVATILAVLLITGCASNLMLRQSTDEEAKTRDTTHAFIGDCIFRKEGEAFEALAATVISRVISQGINRIGKALQDAAAEQTKTVFATTNFETNSRHFPKCIQIVRGKFYSTRNDTTYDWIGGTEFAGKKSKLEENQIYLAENPAFFFEGRFREAIDSTVLSIAPLFVQFNWPIETRVFRPGLVRHVKVAFAFHPPERAATDTSNPSTEIILGALAPRTSMTFDTQTLPAILDGTSRGNSSRPDRLVSIVPPALRSEPIAAVPGFTPGPPSEPTPGGPGVPSAQPSGDGNQREGTPQLALPDEGKWFQITRSEIFKPYSVTVAVSETQGASAFLKFVADVFTDSQDEIEKSAKILLIDSERQKAKVAAMQAENAANSAYDQAVVAAIAALKTCSSDGSLANAADARSKQGVANTAAANAGKAPPFRSEVPLSTNPDIVKAACENAHNSSKI